MSTFNNEGIKKISSYVNGNLIERLDKTLQLSEQYNNFTKLENGAKAEAKFVMIIDAIKEHKEQETNKEKAIIEEKEQ